MRGSLGRRRMRHPGARRAACSAAGQQERRREGNVGLPPALRTTVATAAAAVAAACGWWLRQGATRAQAPLAPCCSLVWNWCRTFGQPIRRPGQRSSSRGEERAWSQTPRGLRTCCLGRSHPPSHPPPSNRERPRSRLSTGSLPGGSLPRYSQIWTSGCERSMWSGWQRGCWDCTWGLPPNAHPNARLDRICSRRLRTGCLGRS
eukprot:1188287-Prorocentrum_minimum.AAC.3